MPQQRVMRPLKMQPMPHYMRKNVVYPVYNPTMSTPQRINFHSSPPGPNTGEYVYENPFTSMHMQPVGFDENLFESIENANLATFQFVNAEQEEGEPHRRQ